MVYYDALGHLAADSRVELFAFAQRIDLKRCWYHGKGELSHFDLHTPQRRSLAQAAGATLISPRLMPSILRINEQKYFRSSGPLGYFVLAPPGVE